MGVEVSGYVEGGTVVAAGEMVTVCITVTAPAQPQNRHGLSDDISGEVVSWCSAQIHCICTTNEACVIAPEPYKPASTVPATQGNPDTPGTSFAPWRGETGHLVLTTKPTILFCELQLPPGRSRTYRYRETVPCSAPPSYRGHHVKYSWKVAVGAQRHGHKVALIRLPLRVMLLPQPSAGVLESGYSESDDELSPSNPFLHPSSNHHHLTAPPHHHHLTTPPAALLQVWGSRSVRAYNVVHSHGHVVKFSIFRSHYRLGDDILATLDFANGQIPCVQYSVCLQSVESISPRYSRRGSGGKGSHGATCPPSVVSYSKSHELCLALTHTSLLLPVPLHVTPAFETDMVTLEYRLHFEFVLSLNDSNKKSANKAINKKSSKATTDNKTSSHPEITSKNSNSTDLPSPNNNSTPRSSSSTDTTSTSNTNMYEEGGWVTQDDGSLFWRAPHQLDIETLVWDLPVTICPSLPNQLAAALNLPESFAQMVV